MIDIESAPGAVFLSISCPTGSVICEMTPGRALEMAEGLRQLAQAAQLQAPEIEILRSAAA